MKILPVAEPPVRGYLYYAYHLIVLSNYRGYDNWLHSNYIQIECDPNYQVHLYTTIWHVVRDEFTSRSALRSLGMEIVPFVIDSLEQDYYVMTYVDEFYIPGKRCYQREHNFHEILIYGYLPDRAAFLTVGYNHEQKFIAGEVSYSDFQAAFNAPEANTTIKLFKKRQDVDFDLNTEDIRELLLDLLYSRNTYKRFKRMGYSREGCVYGLEVYDRLAEYLGLLATGEEEYDHRQMYLLWEHKKCMVNRLKFLHDRGCMKSGSTIPAYEEIERKALVLRNMLLKTRVTGDTSVMPMEA